ncbi:hypothetical protein E2C01_001933 [Portunus trituberculatus]|uniref:Uncharacterized protein n=1 Tax=Portunus trituberculatus TaxID=210409 RepID=A0A5B7CJ77_PORTR|nr:hypothetical protein [Portunus trituberculatus]
MSILPSVALYLTRGGLPVLSLHVIEAKLFVLLVCAFVLLNGQLRVVVWGVQVLHVVISSWVIHDEGDTSLALDHLEVEVRRGKAQNRGERQKCSEATGGDALRDITRAVSVKIAEDGKMQHSTSEKRLKTVSHRRGVDETKNS